MKRIAMLVMFAALVCAVNSSTAEEGGVRIQIQPAGNPGVQVLTPNAAGGSIGFGGFSGKSASSWYIESIEKTVALTPEQREAMTKIMEKRDKDSQEFQTKNADKMKSAMQAMTDAYKGKDKEAIEKATKAYQEASAGSAQIYKKAQSDLDNVLTAEQKTKRQEAMVAQTIKSLTDPAVLTPEQTAKIKELIAKNTAAGERAERNWYQSVQNVLTPEQNAAIAKHRALSYAKAVYGRVNMTPDQMKKVESAYDELAKTPGIKPEEVTKQLYERVNGLLTAEQKEAMKKNAWSGLQPGASPNTPAQTSKQPAGATQTIKVGEGGETLSFTINGENVKVNTGGTAGGTGQIIRLGEGQMNMARGPWLGLATEPVSEVLGAQLSLAKGEGLVISQVIGSSPANRAGLQKNDVLVRLDDQIIVDQTQLRKLVAMKKAGDTVKLVYIRKAERKEATTTLVDHQIESSEHSPNPWTHMTPGHAVWMQEGNHEMKERQEQLKKTQEKPRTLQLAPGAPLNVKPQGAKNE
jgi:Spy/CpxP family protein refolding chaperone